MDGLDLALSVWGLRVSPLSEEEIEREKVEDKRGEKGETGGKEEEGGNGEGEGREAAGGEGGGKDTGEGGRWEGGLPAKCDSELGGRRKDEKARNQLQGKDERGREQRKGEKVNEGERKLGGRK